jgi:hypothetical protein
MSAQSKVLREMVGGLVQVLEGTNGKKEDLERPSVPEFAEKKSGKKGVALNPRPVLNPLGLVKAKMALAAPKQAAEKMIPLSDEELKNF